MNMKCTALALLSAVIVLANAAPASAAPEGWREYKTGDVGVSLNLGPAVGVAPQGAPVFFSFFNELEYHVSGGLGAGGLLNLNITGGAVGIDLGPGIKYRHGFGNGFVAHGKFHLPILILAGAATTAGIGFRFGGGGRYYIHRQVGIGLDLGFMPAVLFSEGTPFGFRLDIQLGVDVKL